MLGPGPFRIKKEFTGPRSQRLRNTAIQACVSLDYKSHSHVEEVAGSHGELCEQCRITGSLTTGDTCKGRGRMKSGPGRCVVSF